MWENAETGSVVTGRRARSPYDLIGNSYGNLCKSKTDEVCTENILKEQKSGIDRSVVGTAFHICISGSFLRSYRSTARILASQGKGL